MSITIITPRKIKIGSVAQKPRMENGKNLSKMHITIALIRTTMDLVDVLLPHIEHL
jgi:hypothetical protein